MPEEIEKSETPELEEMAGNRETPFLEELDKEVVRVEQEPRLPPQEKEKASRADELLRQTGNNSAKASEIKKATAERIKTASEDLAKPGETPTTKPVE